MGKNAVNLPPVDLYRRNLGRSEVKKGHVDRQQVLDSAISKRNAEQTGTELTHWVGLIVLVAVVTILAVIVYICLMDPRFQPAMRVAEHSKQQPPPSNLEV